MQSPSPRIGCTYPSPNWALWPSVPILLKSVLQPLTHPLSPLLLTPLWENDQNEQEWLPGQRTEPKLQLAWNILLGLAGYLLLLTHYASNCLPPIFNASQPKQGGVWGQVNLLQNMSSTVIPDKLLASPSNLLIKWQGSPCMQEFVSYCKKLPGTQTAGHGIQAARHGVNVATTQFNGHHGHGSAVLFHASSCPEMISLN